MPLRHYITEINKRYTLGNATEHTYRGDLQRLIEALAPDIRATNEPKRQKCGAPDYILTKKDIEIGYIEAKNIGDSDLEGKKTTGNKEQFNRYKNALGNLVFTDYLEFYFYRDGVLTTHIAIGEINGKSIHSLNQNFAQFTNLIKDFCSYTGQTIKSSQKLAQMMAGKARLLANIIENALNSENGSQENNTIKGHMQGFKSVLIHDITPKQFADVYAQTITYGMFAARLHDATLETFSRQKAAELIPKSNPFLRKLFNYIAGPDIDDRIQWIVDNLCRIFLACNVKEMLQHYGKDTKMEDPIVHFYEDFLAEYDPTLRKARGVWYTPKPVVDFIVRAVDDILKTDFALTKGLADTSKTTVTVQTHTADNRSPTGFKQVEKAIHKVQILDPATGTGTFLAQTIKHIHAKFKGQQGIWSGYVENELIPRLNGFEILMASYAMAHLKLDMLLDETGYQASKTQRLKVFLTNSLEEYHPETGTLFTGWLSQEANYIKRDTPVMVVMGNPPYSGESANRGEWIMGLMEDYKKEPEGKEKLKERNPKWINDDYVKFIRYGQHFIEKNGSGILAYINPHGYLDNPTFRGMRWHLLKTFDKIYTIDLHGNSKKKETAPDGSPDQNVFDIMQGVSINLFIKTGKKKANSLGKVYHYDLYGKRQGKYDFLDENNLAEIPFVELTPDAPNYFFAAKDNTHRESYAKGFAVNDLFPLNNVGIVTAKDEVLINENKSLLSQSVQKHFGVATENDKIQQIVYRPFDSRFIYYDTKLVARSREKLMQHFLKGENVGLVFKLGNPEEKSASAMVSKSMIDFRSWSRPGMQGGDYVAPLYLYHDAKETLEDGFILAHRTPNLNPDIVKQIVDTLELTFVPEKFPSAGGVSEGRGGQNTFAPIDLLDYIYAVLHSPCYRETYKEFLKIDFPRVPYPKDVNTFWQMVHLGGKIRQIHLLENPSVEDYITEYPESGDNTVTKPYYQNGNVHINDRQYFANVPEVAWNFYIGGYQPAQKWLKDRKERTLNFEDILHYQKIINALQQTHVLMQKVDAIDFIQLN